MSRCILICCQIHRVRTDANNSELPQNSCSPDLKRKPSLVDHSEEDISDHGNKEEERNENSRKKKDKKRKKHKDNDGEKSDKKHKKKKSKKKHKRDSEEEGEIM